MGNSQSQENTKVVNPSLTKPCGDVVKITQLIHNTRIDTAVKILESGYVYTELDAIMKKVNLGEGLTSAREQSKMRIQNLDLDQYPGVYMAVKTNKMAGEKVAIFSDTLDLVFCTSLLKRGDWHFNKGDSEGFINSGNTIFSPKFLEDYFQNPEDKENEIVFHHSVPINFLCKIRCKNLADANTLVDKCPVSLKEKVSSMIEVLSTLPATEYLCPGPVKELTPNYCFVFDDNFHYKTVPGAPRGYYEDMSYYRWMARQCGLSDEKANSAKTPQELNDMLRPLVYKKFEISVGEKV